MVFFMIFFMLLFMLFFMLLFMLFLVYRIIIILFISCILSSISYLSSLISSFSVCILFIIFIRLTCYLLFMLLQDFMKYHLFAFIICILLVLYEL